MKITRVRRQAISVPLRKPIPSAKTLIRTIDCILVFVESDAGLVGEGLVFTLNGLRLAVLDEMIRSLEPLVIGTDPTDSGIFWAKARADFAFLGQRGVTAIGLSALDMALWDLRAKAASLNVSRLIGRCRGTVPIYRSNGLRLSTDIDALQVEAKGYVDQGFKAMKMSLGSKIAGDDLARVRAVRDAIGPGITLMTDCNQQFTAAQAIRLGRELEAFDLAWIEEPVPSHDHAAEAAVAAALDMPVASGENEYSLAGMVDMLQHRSADILMPDLQRMGGPTELIKVANIAEAFKTPITPHLFSEMSLSLAAALPNVLIGEYVAWFEDLYAERIVLDPHGHALVPEAPGWGLAFDPKAVERFSI